MLRQFNAPLVTALYNGTFNYCYNIHKLNFPKLTIIEPRATDKDTPIYCPQIEDKSTDIRNIKPQKLTSNKIHQYHKLSKSVQSKK